MSEYIFERVTPEHYPFLQDLYLNAYNSAITIEGIQKRFDTSSLGCAHIGFIAIHTPSQKAAAYYGVFPHQLTIKSEQINVCQAGDAMTHTEHRNKGLFILLANKTFDLCKEQGLQLVYGFPNESSYHGHIKKLHWTHTDNIDRLDIKLSFKTFPLPKLLSRQKKMRKLYLRYAKIILRGRIMEAPAIFTNTFPGNHPKVYRDKNYLAYKQSKDKFFIKIDNQLIWIKLTDVFWIGDFSDYTSLKPSLIKKLRRLAFWLGYNTISFHINNSLQLPGFFSVFKKFNTDALCMLSFNSSLDYRNILLTGADFDTF